jgi:hypothetical protein
MSNHIKQPSPLLDWETWNRYSRERRRRRREETLSLIGKTTHS